jgi:hypothetical protein
MKYINLKNNELIGGGKPSAKIYFINNLSKNDDMFIEFKQKLESDVKKKLIDVSFIISKDKLEGLFGIFYDKLSVIFKDTNLKIDKHIDFIVKSYLNNTFGDPSSLENIGRYLDSIQNYDTLKNKGSVKPFNEFNGLIDLESYLSTPEIEQRLKEINQLKVEDEASKMEPIFETSNLKVYNPQRKEQAIRYGKHTKWCTASKNQNMFDFYRSQGELYILISKNKKIPDSEQLIKFQLHFETKSLMNDKDEPVKFDHMLSIFNDDKILLDWLKELILNNPLSILSSGFKGTYLEIPNSIFIDTIPGYDNIQIVHETIYKLLNELDNKQKIIELSIDLDIPLENIILEFTNLQKLFFIKKFNQQLGKSLSRLTLLQELQFDGEFNQELGDSLSQLKLLQKLYFGGNFNQELGDSLSQLTLLKKLYFGHKFNQKLGNSLSQLKLLQDLELCNSYNLPLLDSLSQLTALTSLNLGNSYNLPLLDSLSQLTALTSLNLGNNFNQKLGDSLSQLTALTSLNLGNNFNQKLGDSLSQLINLKKLIFGNNFNQQLGNSLSQLINLKKLIFGNNFNKKLENSLSQLTALTSLNLGNSYNEELGDSLSQLKSLNALELGDKFNQSLRDSLLQTTSLISLSLGNSFNKELGDALLSLTNLKVLSLGDSFNKPLGHSLSQLKSLINVNFGFNFNQQLHIALSYLKQPIKIKLKFTYNQLIKDVPPNITIKIKKLNMDDI